MYTEMWTEVVSPRMSWNDACELARAYRAAYLPGEALVSIAGAGQASYTVCVVRTITRPARYPA